MDPKTKPVHRLKATRGERQGKSFPAVVGKFLVRWVLELQIVQ